MGRLDEQVKVRGYRVELGEITQCLHSLDTLQQAVVRLESLDVSEQLVAYIVFETHDNTTTQTDNGVADIQSTLAALLPDYMLPQQFIVVDSIPLTVNGKVDWQALSALAQPDVKAESRAAQTDNERTLLTLWQDILKREDIGVTDNFFALGGDSILSLQVIAKAKRAGLKLLPKQVFDNPTIESLALVAKSLDKQPQQTNTPISGEAPLTPIQQ
jgi:aryl carrier-like protein